MFWRVKHQAVELRESLGQGNNQSEAVVLSILAGDYGGSHAWPRSSHHLSPIHFALDAIYHPSPLQWHIDKATNLVSKTMISL